MRKIFSVDRFEGEYAVIECDDGGVFNVKRSVIESLSERDVFSAIYENGELSDITLLEEERERRLDEAKKRLQRFKIK